MKKEFDVCSKCNHLKLEHKDGYGNIGVACYHNWPYDSWYPDDNTCKCDGYED